MAIVEAARGLCDLVWVVDTADVRVGSMTRLLARFGPVIDAADRSVDEIADELGSHGVDGILALADDLLSFTAAVADRLGLPFHSPETARRLTDKAAQRAALRAGGLPSPGCWIVSAGTGDSEWTDLGSEVVFPGVLKPRRGEGSRNTALVTSMDEVRRLVMETADAGRPDRDWVLEEYIPDTTDSVCGEGFADYVSVESFVAGGAVTHLAITGRTPPAWPFRETGFFIPAAVDASLAEALLATAAAAARAIGVGVGCLHTEIKLTPDGPVVIEVNGRIGGGVPEMLALTGGIDFLAVALKLALGEEIGCVQRAPRGVGFLLYVQAPSAMRHVRAVTGLDALRTTAGVTEIVMNRGPGSDVDWHDGNHGHVYSVLGLVDDHDRLREMIELVPRLVTIDGD
jgi:biotin carboxylase